jgi:hypothetical protein
MSSAPPSFISLTDAPSPPEKTKPPSKPPLFIPLDGANGTDPAKPDGGFLDRALATSQAALDAVMKSPKDALIGAGKSVASGAEDLTEQAAQGVMALGHAIFVKSTWDSNKSLGENAQINANRVVDQFVQDKNDAAKVTGHFKNIVNAVVGVNMAPEGKEQEATSKLLGILPDAVNAAGDTVYEKTGSALFGAGAQAGLTLLMLKPGAAAEIGKSVMKPKSVASAGFDELAAKNPEGASTLADHVGQVDPMLAKYMRKKIDKFTQASEEELGKLGRDQAEAAIRELEAPPMDQIITPRPTDPRVKGIEGYQGTAGLQYKGPDAGRTVGEMPPKPQPRDALGTPLNTPARPITVEQASATIRNTVREAAEEFDKPPEVNPSVRNDVKGTETPAKKPENPEGPKGIYLNSGIPITRDMIESSFRFWHEQAQKIPGVVIAEGKLATLYDKYIRTFNPEAMGPEAKIAGSTIAKNYFKQASKEHQIWETAKKRRDYWNAMGSKAGMQFIDGFERGVKFQNPLWEKARQGYKLWADAIYRQDMKTGFKYDPRDNYMPHLFRDEDGVRRWLEKKYGNKWADPRFIKERGFDLYSQAISDGHFTPKYTNPEDIMIARQRASDIAQMRVDIFNELEKYGVARKVPKGVVKPPEGFSPNSYRSPTGQRYWVHEGAEQLAHNAFESKSLWENPNLVGDMFKGYMEAKNRIIPLKLALSLFHPTHIMHIDAAANLTRSFKELFVPSKPPMQKLGKFFMDMAMGIPFSPQQMYKSLVSNPRLGNPLLKAFQGKIPMDSLNEAQKYAMSILTESGMIPTRPREEMSGVVQSYKDAVASRSASAIFKAPFAFLAGMGHPIYSVWIPSLKIASVLKDAKVAMELNPGMTALQRQVMLRNIAKKVEARYGEMNYNSMFMSKAIKDIGVATNLSFGWNVGLLDQYAGGAIDLGKAVGQQGSLSAKVKAGLLDRPVMAMTYVSTAMMIGGLMHKMFTGQDPQTVEDYTHPKSGEKDKYGKDMRLNTMFYTREFEGLAKHIQSEGAFDGITEFIANKGSGLFEMGKAAITGVDGLGQEIRRENDPTYKKIEETLAYELADINSLTIEAIQKSTGNKTKAAVLSTLGFTPAGKYISQSVTENKISNDFNKYVRPKQESYDRVMYSKDLGKLQEAYNSNDPKYNEMLEKARKDYDLKPEDVRKLEKRLRREDDFDINEYMFSRLEWKQQKDLLDQMTPEERQKYLPRSNKKHLRNNYEAPAQ